MAGFLGKMVLPWFLALAIGISWAQDEPAQQPIAEPAQEVSGKAAPEDQKEPAATVHGNTSEAVPPDMRHERLVDAVVAIGDKLNRPIERDWLTLILAVFSFLTSLGVLLIRYWDRKKAKVETRAEINQLLHEAFYLLGGDVRNESITNYTTNPENIVEAKFKIETANIKDPDHALVYVRMADYFRAKEQVDSALKEYEKALELDSNLVEALVDRGHVYSEKNDLDLAIKDLNKALGLNPKCVDAYNNRGAVYWKKDKPDLAIRDFNDALSLNPKFAVAYNNRGTAYYHKGELDGAIQDYDQALTLDPNDYKAVYNRARAHHDNGNKALAKADFKAYLKIVPDTDDQKEFIDRAKTFLKKIKIETP